jgi:pimeloyl-ACP methyl ester carboxylesterase
VRILSRGLDRAGAGPVVVFEGGSSTPLEAWTALLDELDEDISLIAYDPPGIGESEWDGVRPTPGRVAQRMRSVLAEAGARPPYVLVGHSWTGWVVRAFEGRYPGEVGGMVLIDPTPSVSEFMTALAEVGVGDQGLVEFARLGERMTADAPEAIRARQRVISDYLEDRSDPNVPDAPSVPVVVLVAGRYDSTEPPEQLRPPFDVQAFFAALQRRKPAAPVEWVNASPSGTLIYAAGSPHCIHCTDPDLVAEAIRRVLAQAARSR